jgi:hypothetical protein
MSHTSNDFYINDNYPLTVDVFAADGETPVLPESATIDIINQTSGVEVVTGASCQVASGLATYYVLSGTDVALNAGNYVGYIRVVIDADITLTQAVPFNVLTKGSYIAVDRWRHKVQDSAPSEDHISDDHGRDWIDDAVGYLNTKYDTTYLSTLGVITPAPSAGFVELVARVASLMARSAWWAGKGTWRDAEMSFDGTPFAAEWAALEATVSVALNDTWFDLDIGGTVYNRDNVFYDGVKYDSPDYWYRTSTQVDPDTEIPI